MGTNLGLSNRGNQTKAASNIHAKKYINQGKYLAKSGLKRRVTCEAATANRTMAKGAKVHKAKAESAAAANHVANSHHDRTFSPNALDKAKGTNNTRPDANKRIESGLASKPRRAKEYANSASATQRAKSNSQTRPLETPISDLFLKPYSTATTTPTANTTGHPKTPAPNKTSHQKPSGAAKPSPAACHINTKNKSPIQTSQAPTSKVDHPPLLQAAVKPTAKDNATTDISRQSTLFILAYHQSRAGQADQTAIPATQTQADENNAYDTDS